LKRPKNANKCEVSSNLFEEAKALKVLTQLDQISPLGDRDFAALLQEVRNLDDDVTLVDILNAGGLAHIENSLKTNVE
jgi:hypothetical protein